MPLPAFLSGLFGAKPKDIELPNETGTVDPRLPQPNAQQQWKMQNQAALAGLRGPK